MYYSLNQFQFVVLVYLMAGIFLLVGYCRGKKDTSVQYLVGWPFNILLVGYCRGKKDISVQYLVGWPLNNSESTTGSLIATVKC
jgi:hypothetical protein